jgi:DNA (cytosine-5)-methyltransferase 1
MKKSKIKFIDLFAGIGGFHLAVRKILPNSECVWACEKDAQTAKIYTMNFGIEAHYDITQVDETIIPKFDLLCAGFPCQPFSKGGDQKGFADIRGTLFFDIIRIVRYHKPNYILLENVSNIVSHDNGNTYKVIIESLKDLGYKLPEIPLKISPHELGLPIQRNRVFILAVNEKISKPLNIHIERSKEEFRKTHLKNTFTFDTIINDNSVFLNKYEIKVLKMWDEFHKGIKSKSLGFPIWYDYFQWNEPIDDLPKWKQNFIIKNKQLYLDNKSFITKWQVKFDNLNWVNNTQRKFEWQCGSDYSSIFECIIQFRPSGVRVKRPNNFSTLVAMNHTQIIGWLGRRLTLNEAKKLQGFDENYQLSENRALHMKQLGNAVNVNVVAEILKSVFHHGK